MISEREFTIEMNRLTAVFSTFSKHRYSRVFSFVERLPLKALQDIVDTMIDNFAHAPLPKDFLEAAIAWQKRNPIRDALDVTPIYCTDCYDTGYLFGHFAPGEPEVLFHCFCAAGTNALSLRPRSRIPQWEKGNFDVAFGMIRNAFPVSWFVPSADDQEAFVKDPKQSSKVKEWVHKIKSSERYFQIKCGDISS